MGMIDPPNSQGKRGGYSNTRIEIKVDTHEAQNYPKCCMVIASKHIGSAGRLHIKSPFCDCKPLIGTTNGDGGKRRRQVSASGPGFGATASPALRTLNRWDVLAQLREEGLAQSEGQGACAGYREGATRFIARIDGQAGYRFSFFSRNGWNFFGTSLGQFWREDPG
jgi:hypothetical protein